MVVEGSRVGEGPRDEVAADLVRYARRLGEADLGVGTAGNLSARTTDGLMITPSARLYDELEPSDMVEIDLEGRVLAGSLRPSTEWRFHAALYEARPTVGAVVHAHPPYASALSCHRREIPPFHYMVAIAGGPTIRCAPYARPGSARLAALALAAIEDRTACLLANHGLIAVGTDLAEAFRRAVEVESLSRQYLLAATLGEPTVLSSGEMEEVLAHVERYRQEGD